MKLAGFARAFNPVRALRENPCVDFGVEVQGLLFSVEIFCVRFHHYLKLLRLGTGAGQADASQAGADRRRVPYLQFCTRSLLSAIKCLSTYRSLGSRGSRV